MTTYLSTFHDTLCAVKPLMPVQQRVLHHRPAAQAARDQAVEAQAFKVPSLVFTTKLALASIPTANFSFWALCSLVQLSLEPSNISWAAKPTRGDALWASEVFMFQCRLSRHSDSHIRSNGAYQSLVCCKETGLCIMSNGGCFLCSLETNGGRWKCCKTRCKLTKPHTSSGTERYACCRDFPHGIVGRWLSFSRSSRG